jgi:transcriptional regulator with XRE-family HTH domain
VSIVYREIGQRLRAYRMGKGLTPEEVAARLKISRAALYRYEKGELIKLDTIERLADLLEVSLPSLLGVGVEYFSNAASFFERMRQLEAESEQVIAYFEPVSYLLTSANYPKRLQQMLIEGLPAELQRRAALLDEIKRVMAILDARRSEPAGSHPAVTSIVGATQVRRFLRVGLVGTFNLPTQLRAERRQAAREEIEHIADLMDNEPIGVQIGIVDDTLPNQTFQIFRLQDKEVVGVSSFRLAEFPNIRLGVASVTAAKEAIALYRRVADDLWRRAHKGARGASFLRQIISEAGADAPRARPQRKLTSLGR